MLKARRSELLLILSALLFASNGIAAKLLLDGHITADRKIVEATDGSIMELPESAF